MDAPLITYKPPPLYTQDQYASLMVSLFPQGPVWPRETDSTLYMTCAGLALVYNRTNSRANYLLTDSFPSTAVELLPDWENTLGLPGRFGYTGTDVPTRQRQVVAALTDSGGQSIAFFVNKAAQMGFTISIIQYTSGSVESPVDFAMYDAAWAFAWEVNVPIGTDTTTLAAMLDAYKPAHTTYFFNFV